MKKALFKILILCMAICSALCVFASCGDNGGNSSGGESQINFKLNFIVDNETVKTIYTTGNEKIVLPNDPQKEGYTFDGWYLDEETWENLFSADSLLNAPVSKSISVYAKFTAIEYTATFIANGEEVGTAMFTIEDTEIAHVPQIPEKVGYAGVWEEYTIIADNITINAIYTINKYTVIWQNYDGKVLKTDENVEHGTILEYDGKIPEKPADAQYTYTFDKWEPVISGITGDISFTATYQNTLNKYTIVWKNFDGTVLETDDNVPYGEMPEYNGVKPQKTDNQQYSYEFENIWTPAVETVKGYVEYTAQFTQITNKYTLTFYDEDRTTVLGTATVDYGTNATYPKSTPIKEQDNGYTYAFDKWLKADNTADDLKNVIENRDVFVSFAATPRVYNVYYIENGGNDIADGTYTYGVGIATLPNESLIARGGYTFEGWQDGQNNAVSSISTETYGDITLYAEWQTVTYYARFYADNALVDTKPFTVEHCEIVNPAVPEKIGYTGVWEGYSIIADNIIINVIYTPIIYTISYILEGGINSKNNPFNYTIESETIVFEPANKEGYDFIEWDIKKIEKGSYGDKKIRASYSLAIYNINYILDGGINSIKNPSTYTILDTLTFGDASKTGYSFGGWFTDAELVNGIEVINENYGELSLYAKFIPLEFTATFISEEFVEYNVYLFYWEDSIYNRTLTYKDGDTFDIYSFEIPSRNEYFFGGWFLEPEFINPLEKEFYVYRSITVYAKWYEKEKIVGYSSSAIELTRNISLSASSSDGVDYYSRDFYVSSTYDCNIIIQYYVYAGCSITSLSASQGRVYLYDATDSEYVFNISTTKGSSNSEISVMLKWGHYYHIYCYARGKKSTSHYGYGPYTASASARIKIMGIERSSQNSIVSNIVPEQYDSQMIFPTPCREGYDFVGWYDENDNMITDVWTYTSDKEFHAVWSIHNYSIEYVLNGGVNDPSNPKFYNLNDTIELSNPTRDGYDFTGWYSDSAFKNNITVIDGNACKDYVLYAKWIPKTYTATLNYDGGQNCPTVNFYSNGQIIKSQDLYKDSTIECFVPTVPNSKLIFGGWYLDQAFAEQFSFDGIINRDLNVYAKWIEVSDAEYSDLGNNVSVLINGNTYNYIAVVPLIDQSVTVTSLSEFDLYGAIYDANRNLIAFCDDISDVNLDFAITLNMQAGQVYYIGYKANQASVSGDATISITGSNVVSTHITGDSEIIETISATYDAEFSLPTPKKEGYHFIGWYDMNDNPISGTWGYLSDQTFVAKWEKRS